MAWTPEKTWSTGDNLPAADLNTYLRDNLTFLHDRGADLASAGTITPTTQFHKVTGTTQIDNIAAPTDGHTVFLWFGSSLTVRNNGGGTGNIRTANGLDKVVPADTIVVFRSDGTVWKEYAPGVTSTAVLVADSLLGSAAASIDIQNILTGTHLRVILLARSDVVATTVDLDVRFNNDSGANYDRIQVKSDGAAITAASAYGGTEIGVPAAMPAASGNANLFGVAELVIPEFRGTTAQKAGTVATARKALTGSNFELIVTGVQWRSTSAISRVTLYGSGGGNLIAGSRATVYV